MTRLKGLGGLKMPFKILRLPFDGNAPIIVDNMIFYDLNECKNRLGLKLDEARSAIKASEGETAIWLHSGSPNVDLPYIRALGIDRYFRVIARDLVNRDEIIINYGLGIIETDRNNRDNVEIYRILDEISQDKNIPIDNDD
jgi:hypothetical protein